MYGWLSKRDLPPHVNGIPLDPELPTRREEYTLVYESVLSLTPGYAVDLGAGYTPERHIASPVLASLGWSVIAMDNNPRILEMPPNPRIKWLHKDFLEAAPYLNRDLAVCISVLEHLEPEERRKAAENITNIVKDGGTLIVTADEFQPEELVSLFPAFDFGPRQRCDVHLMPQVAFAVGIKGPRQVHARLCSKCDNNATVRCAAVLGVRLDFTSQNCAMTQCGAHLCDTCQCHTQPL